MPNRVGIQPQRSINGRRNEVERRAVAVHHLAAARRVSEGFFFLTERRKEVQTQFAVGFIAPFVGGDAVLGA